jgi:hypothetical protein
MQGNHIHWQRVVAAVSGAALAIGALLIITGTIAYARPALPKHTVSSISTNPVLTITPDALTFQVEWITPTIQTQTLRIVNLQADAVVTWSIAINPSAQVQPIVTPISGTTDATVTVQIDLNSITSIGAYHADLIITAEPTTTSGVPFTVPVDVIVITPTYHIYLPIVTQNFTGLSKPPVPSMGLAFVSSAEALANGTRYQRAADSGGQFNRRPMYWPNIEKDAIDQPRVFDWTQQDASIVADINHGLKVLPILMLTPGGLDTGGSRSAPAPQVGDGLRALLNNAAVHRPAIPASVTTPPQGLYLSVFGDGSDEPGPGKSINLDNRWAVFVNATVNRYRPGGILAQAHNWNTGQGVSHWEVWNEEDLDHFFSGSPADYARLLKVAYLAATQADPQATIVMGGLAQYAKPHWLNDVLNVIATDPMSITHHGFMDALAAHNYLWTWQTFGYLYQDRVQLNAHGLSSVKLWLTETGVPACDDPPGPDCTDPQNRWYRAAPEEQSAFLIQSAAYAAWLKAQTFVWFQLYDDCGNACGIDAFGLVRNDNTTRPVYQTYQLAVDQLADVQPYWRDRRTLTATNWISGNQEILAFQQPASGERIVVMWTRYYTDGTVLLDATAPSAQLFSPDGSAQIIYPISGTYAISLPRATNRNLLGTIDGAAPDGTAPIGGSPRILVEFDPAVRP